jgi:alpha-D-xyloside xylohydrolase
VVGRLRGLTLVITAAAAVAAGCASGGSGAGLSVHVERTPFRISVERNGKTVVAEDQDARLRYQLASNGLQHKLTNVISSHGDVYDVATDESGRTATVTVAPTKTGVRVAVQLHPATNVAMVFDAFDTGAGDHFLGGGEQSSAVDLRGQIVPVKVGCASLSAPFFASSAGWALRLATTNTGAFAFPGSAGGTAPCRYVTPPPCTFPALQTRAETCVQGAALDEDVYVGTFAQTLGDYEAATGKPRVPPQSELALIKWRDSVTGPQQLLDDISHLRSAGIPIGWELLDNPWESCVGTLSFNPKTFPDPSATIAAIHKRGVRFMLWVSPLVECDAGYPRSAFLGNEQQYVLDLRKPKIAHEFEARLRKLVALGVDGFKADRGDEVDFGNADPTLQNTYPLLYARDVTSVQPKGAAIFRAGSAGSQAIVPGVWAGDQEDTFAGLQQAILDGATAGMSGFATWGSDVGGYENVAPLSGELFARWAQLGAVSPVLEVGGQGANATPWQLGSQAMADLRAAAVLHYELAPLFESLLAGGGPVLRPLGYEFPDDAGAWGAQYELMVGSNVLAAPVTAGGTTPSVYLPPGRWLDLYTGKPVAGGGPSFTRPTPLDQFPLYLRAGAVVPFDLRTATGSWWGLNELSHAGRTGYLAAPGARLDLRGQPAGVQVFVPAARRPGVVTLGGRSVAFTWTPGPLPGVVIRVHGPVVRGVVRLGPA